jgi:hypothetical protein
LRVLPVLVLIAAAAYGGVIFSDDFEDGGDEGWAHYGGAGFQVSSGVYWIYSNGTGTRGISYSGDAGGYMSQTDYSMLAMIYFDAGYTAGIAVRYSDEGEWFYELVLDSVNDQVVLGRGKSGGALIPLDTVSLGIPPGYHCWMRLEVSGTALGGKVWTGTPADEPSDWLLLADDDTQADPGSVALFVTGQFAAGNVTWTCGYDDVTVTDDITLPLSHGTWASIKALCTP